MQRRPGLIATLALCAGCGRIGFDLGAGADGTMLDAAEADAIGLPPGTCGVDWPIAPLVAEASWVLLPRGSEYNLALIQVEDRLDFVSLDPTAAGYFVNQVPAISIISNDIGMPGANLRAASGGGTTVLMTPSASGVDLMWWFDNGIPRAMPSQIPDLTAEVKSFSISDNGTLFGLHANSNSDPRMHQFIIAGSTFLLNSPIDSTPGTVSEEINLAPGVAIHTHDHLDDVNTPQCDFVLRDRVGGQPVGVTSVQFEFGTPAVVCKGASGAGLARSMGTPPPDNVYQFIVETAGDAAGTGPHVLRGYTITSTGAPFGGGGGIELDLSSLGDVRDPRVVTDGTHFFVAGRALDGTLAVAQIDLATTGPTPTTLRAAEVVPVAATRFQLLGGPRPALAWERASDSQRFLRPLCVQ